MGWARAMTRLRRREGLRWARALQCLSTSIGPVPRMVQRRAQSAMRNNDHGLSGLADCVSPGGKRAVRVEEFLSQGRGKKAGQHPRSCGRASARRQAIEVEQGFEALEQQFDLPARRESSRISAGLRRSAGAVLRIQIIWLVRVRAATTRTAIQSLALSRGHGLWLRDRLSGGTGSMSSHSWPPSAGI